MSHPEWVVEAAANWERATGVRFEISITPEPCSGAYCEFVEEVSADQLSAGAFSHCVATSWGCTLTWADSQSGHTRLRGDLGEWGAFAMTHELGHVLGLMQHVDGTVMGPSVDRAAHDVTCEDVVRYRELRGERGGFCSP